MTRKSLSTLERGDEIIVSCDAVKDELEFSYEETRYRKS